MSESNDIIEAGRLIEALIFASSEPVSRRALMVYVEDEAMLGEAVQAIAARYDEASGIELAQVGDDFAFRTRADIAARLNMEKPVERNLSRAALEVLAIIAYHQPITRAEIEEIRGISLSRGTMDILLELSWIRPRGRRRTPGRPLTWGTSANFLDHFGLSNISDLPGVDELRATGLLRKGHVLSDLAGELGEDESESALFPDDPDLGEFDEPDEDSDTDRGGE